MTTLAEELSQLSADEMVAALGVRRGPAALRRGLALPFLALSQRLGRTLAAFDAAVPDQGLSKAARGALAEFGVRLAASGELRQGPLLVVANHPGAYDALAILSALGRKDVLILAADRSFLRALPRVSQHLAFVGGAPEARARALRGALSYLRGGGAVLHFPAGEIEPDADFEPRREHWLKPWQPGVVTLVRACVRAGGRVGVAGVRGVHSPKAKRSLLNRLAERRGITTLSPLLQIVAGLDDVLARVRLEPLDGTPANQALAEPNLVLLRERLLDAISRA